MIIYNVTVNVEEEVCQLWETWMKDKHIPEVMKTGMFISYSFHKLLTRQDDETGTTYVIQYSAPDMKHYEKYQQEFAPSLQADALKMFKDKFIAFRTVMEKIG
ncbi:MAG: DUF4286 family protein [Bacteroidia bacterium]|jgi:hypothetical protein|nr:DUF4286 family protein [Bacteroidia bacterium]